MKKAIALIGVLLGAVSFSAAQNIEHEVVASQFAQWKLQGTQPLVSGSNTVVPFGPCQTSAGGQTFNELSSSTPVEIVDGAGTYEIVTPTSIVVAPNLCTATLAPSNAHPLPYHLTSGTQGLQEAINANVVSGATNTVLLDSWFHAYGGGAATVYGVTGSANISVQDVTLGVEPAWRYASGHYTSAYSVPSGTVTVAAGAAAGTSPTIANSPASNPNVITVTLTEGSAPTTGTLFTETFSTAYPTGGANCVIQSVGNTAAPVVTPVQTSTTVETFTVALAPTAAAQYAFNISCN